MSSESSSEIDPSVGASSTVRTSATRFTRRRWLKLAGGAVAAGAVSPLRQAAGAPSAPEREFRAAWIATVHNLDWPSSPGLAASDARAQLAAQLDVAARLKLNAIIFQVRPAGDAVYASRLEPWSGFLTGRMGASPGFDPLAFAVVEAHKRGMELHAWFNPFRGQAGGKYPPSGLHALARHPEWGRRFGGGLYFDPGLPAVREHAVRVIQDVVARYRVDGVHIDDYFYPYPPKGTTGMGVSGFPDGPTYARYGKGQDKGAWRRANIDAFVSGMYRAMKRTRSSVKVGISPFGIWRPGVPASIQGKLDPYTYLGADARGWLQRGWCDYLSPQLYWSIDSPAQSFSTLLHWWHSQNGSGRHIWPGMAIDRIGSNGRTAREITRQIALSREYARRGQAGQCHWSLKNLRQNRGGIQGALTSGPYAGRALVPACPWLAEAAPPAAPRGVLCHEGTLRWRDDATARWTTLQTWDGAAWSLPEVIPGAGVEGDERGLSLPAGTKLAALRHISDTGQESEPTLVDAWA